MFTFGLNAGQLGKEVINSLKMSSADVVCCIFFTIATNQFELVCNSLDPDQTAPYGAV